MSVATGHASRLIDTGHGEYGAFAWAPDGRRFATTDRDGVVRLRICPSYDPGSVAGLSDRAGS